MLQDESLSNDGVTNRIGRAARIEPDLTANTVLPQGLEKHHIEIGMDFCNR